MINTHNKKYCFKITTAFETELSEDFETAFVKTLTLHAPKKIFRGNDKLHINKVLQKTIIKRPQLKHEVASKTKQPPSDISKHKSQQQLVVKMNRGVKLNYFNNIESGKNSRSFWNKCRPYILNKHAQGDSKIILIKNNDFLTKNNQIAQILNDHFCQAVNSFDLFQ